MKFNMGALNRSAHLFRGKSKMFFRKHGSTLRTTFICVGVVATAVEAARATPGACMAYEDAKMWCEQNGVDFTIFEKFKACGKFYIKTVLLAGGTIGLAIYNEKANLKTVAGLTAALKEANDLRKDYIDAVKDQLGPKKRDELTDKMAEKDFKRNPVPSDPSMIVETGKGSDLFLFEGIWFRSSLVAVDNAILLLKQKIVHENYASENDFFDYLGIDSRLWPSKGEILGWQHEDEVRIKKVSIPDTDKNVVYTVLKYTYESCPYKDYNLFCETDYGRY